MRSTHIPMHHRRLRILVGIATALVAGCTDTIAPTSIQMRRVMNNVTDPCPVTLRAGNLQQQETDSSATLDPSSTSMDEEYTAEECTYTEENSELYYMARPTEEPLTDNVIWNGEAFTPSYSEQAATCPNMVYTGRKVYAWHSASGRAYGFGPSLLKLYDFPPSNGYPGRPHAVYQNTSGRVFSEDGTHELLNAKVRVACMFVVRVTAAGTRLIVGQLAMLGATGRAIPVGDGDGGDEFGGWGHESSGGGRTGGGAGWEQAVHNWVAHGTCTPGFDIYEDGLLVCSADWAI